METALDEAPAGERTLGSADERIKQATDPILRRVQKLCALLSSLAETESTGNSEASSWRRNRGSSSPSRNWYDMVTRVQTNSHRRNRLEKATTMDNLNY